MNILIRNLARQTTSDQIHKLFAEHGNIKSCDLILDAVTGRSKGFAFVDMPINTEANAAIKALNGIKLANNRIRVKQVENK